MAPSLATNTPLVFFCVYFCDCSINIVVTNNNRYFSIAVQDNATDLLISLDAQSGDPDM